MTDEEIEEQAEKHLKNLDDCRTKELMKDNYIDGAKWGMETICKKLLEEVRTHEGIEQMTKFYIGEIIKNLGVENDKEN